MVLLILAASAVISGPRGEDQRDLCVMVPVQTHPIYFVRGGRYDGGLPHPAIIPPMIACNITPPGWRPMSTAPKDGTVIEVRNAFGLLPTYGIYRWGDINDGEKAWVDATPLPPCKNPPPVEMKDENGKVVGVTGVNICGGTVFMDELAAAGNAWRPLTVAPAAYKNRDPTPAQWRAAIAHSRGKQRSATAGKE